MQIILLGLSVWFALAVLTIFALNAVKRYVQLLDCFHYRSIDVSTVRELARRWRPDLTPGEPGRNSSNGEHRVLDDIADSIELARYYRESLFLANGVPQ
jgi:oligoribonuclease (3'-5' exoribonuclease)